MNSIINSKRQGFRNEIRQRQLNNYFAMKRKLICGDMEIEQFYFRTTFQNIVQEKDVQDNLSILNSLSFERELAEQFSTPKDAEQLYYDIIHYLIRVATAHESSEKEDTTIRVQCVNTILNLLSDYHCPNFALAQSICQFLGSSYGNLGINGFDGEMVEVGYLIANLINKQSFGLETEESIIHYILDWIEDLLHIKQENQMAENLYFGLLRLVTSLQTRYRVTIMDLPQLYKAKILNLINITLNNQTLFESCKPGLSLRVANFIHHILPVILTSCPYDWAERFVINIFKQLGTLRKKLVSTLSQTLLRLLTFKQFAFESEAQFKTAASIRNQIRWFIMKTYNRKIVIMLTVMETDMKEKIFEIVYHLIACDLTDSVYFLDQFVEMHIEEWMIKTFDPKNAEMNMHFISLINLATDLKMADCFARFTALTEKYRKQP